jgi:hypothetical protein
MRAGAFENRESAIDVGAEIGFRILDRRHDVGARRQVKDTLDAGTGRHHRRLVRDVALDDFKRRIFSVLIEIGPPAHREIIQYAHATALGQKPVDQVAANEPGSPGYQVQHLEHPIHENPIIVMRNDPKTDRYLRASTALIGSTIPGKGRAPRNRENGAPVIRETFRLKIPKD